MFSHRRCDARIEFLETLVDTLRLENQKLAEQVLIMAEKPIIPVVGSKPANVYYMDDSRQIELVEEGNVPT